MSALYDILSIPFGWVLAFFYEISNSYLLSLFLLTLIVRLILLPSSIKQQKSSAGQLRMQAKVNKIREKYAGNQQKINEATQELYQKEGFNPMSAGCLPMLIQFPIIIGLFGVIYKPMSLVLRISEEIIDKLWDVVVNTPSIADTITNIENVARQREIYILQHFDTIVSSVPEATKYTEEIHTFIDGYKFFGINLAAIPSFKKPDILWVIPALVLVTSLLTSVFMMIKQNKANSDAQSKMSQGFMMLMSPAMSVYFSFILPAGVGIYWCMSNVISFVQTVILSYTHNPKKMVAQLMIDETVEQRSKEENTKKIKKMQDGKIRNS
ncbi:MAG TPA: YidC/Oxa1 family membrane protein insertase [Clostridiales bacterium]|jgi:YidC/Oxa1 family membrane protein insertase|nr:YidC/Oxa1 family membrane protein insertase [Clostridiales bacterium]